MVRMYHEVLHCLKLRDVSHGRRRVIPLVDRKPLLDRKSDRNEAELDHYLHHHCTDRYCKPEDHNQNEGKTGALRQLAQ